ncbi:MAG: cytochrome b/b6 domain-containing protein, partial [Vulcanimicrobiaceae bacterium]
AFVFMANALFYALASLSQNTWKRIIPQRHWLRDAWTATIKELTSPRDAMQPEEYNGAQRLTYTLVMLGGAVMILTGLGLWLGRRAPWLLAIFGGERIALVIHIILAVSLLAFIAIHLVQVLRAGLPTLLGMITGSTTPRPQKTRRALAWGAGVVVLAMVVTVALNATNDARGIPSLLRWAAPARTDISASDRLRSTPRLER